MEGGTTPSQAMIEVCSERLDIDIMAMVRPRGGDFLYSEAEFEVMKRNTAMMRQHDIMGVVFGMLNADGTIDRNRMRELIDLARPLKVTCHRAFDMCRDPFEAIDILLELGVDRLLTSGQELTASKGMGLIAKLQQHVGDEMILMPAVEVTVENVAEIIATTKVREVHVGSNVESPIPSGMRYQNPRVSMGDDTSLDEFAMATTDAKKVAELISQIR